MRFHEITPGANFNQIQLEFRYYVAHNVGKNSWVTCVMIVGVRKIKIPIT
jgi:hypothetical protein